MATPPDPAPKVAPDPDPYVKVRGIGQYFGPTRESNGRHWLREVGDVYHVRKSLVNKACMLVAVDGIVPDVPKDPPPTSTPKATAIFLT